MDVHLTESAELSSLIDRARQRDPDAFDRLVDLYGRRLYSFLYRLTGRRDDAEELVQEVFVRIVRHIADYVHEGRFEAWLFRIAANLARDRVRRLSRRPDEHSLTESEDEGVSEDWSHVDPTRSAPDDQMQRHERVAALHRALQMLPEPEREVVMLRHYGQLSFAEIAHIMKTPLGTALARAHRGLSKLRGIMDGTE